MKIAAIQDFLRSLSTLLVENKGATPAADFEAFCAGLDPFKEMTVKDLANFLRIAEEYHRAGVKPADAKPKPATAKPAKAAATPKPAKAPKAVLKTKADVQAIQEAAKVLQDLYGRAGDPTVTYPQIEATVDKIAQEFDKNGLKAVANAFGLKSGLDSKQATQTAILNHITERKGRQERAEILSAGITKPAETAANVNQGDAAAKQPVPPSVSVVDGAEAIVEVAPETPASPF